MIVYHGSTVEVERPDLLAGRRKLDFGQGFYVTTLQAQAEKWAIRKSNLSSGTPIVSVYDFTPEKLDVLAFEGYSQDWLDFVIQCRSASIGSHVHDAIFGHVADDDVATAVNDYMRRLRIGRATDAALALLMEDLQYSKPSNQYCICTERGLGELTFLESYVPEVCYGK